MSVMLSALASCGSGESEKKAAGTAAPPSAVQVVAVSSTPVPNIVELPGRVEAIRTAEVRARVDGIVERRLYQEGTDVVEGAALFQIDPRDKQAQLQQAKATLASVEVALTNAAAVVKRYEPLVSRNAISGQEYDAAQATLGQAEANVSEARAAVARAQLELNYTRVTAPIAGRAGRANVTEGALVSASTATLLTTVNQLSPIYATFTVSSADVLDLTQQIRAGAVAVPDLSSIEVRLTLENGENYAIVGHLNFADETVEPTTGSQTIRAQFDNPMRTLLPGQFVRGRISAGTLRSGIRVPERAVQINNEGASVATVGSDGSVIVRKVQLGGQSDGEWIIRTGLKPGERVIVEGWQKVQPGQKVTAQPYTTAASQPAPPSQP
jgi:RND family efflux transporter MFP subunit